MGRGSLRTAGVAVAAFLLVAASAGAGAFSGDLDTTFGGTGVVKTVIGDNSSGALDLALQPDGKAIAFGQSDYATGKTGFTLARYLPDGSLDTTFGNGGIVTTAVGPWFAEAEAGLVQPDGKIVAVGEADIGDTTVKYGFGIARYLPNGSLDTTFGSGGVATAQVGTGSLGAIPSAVALQSDGKLLVVGTSETTSGDAAMPSGIDLIRLTPDGALDPTFGAGGIVLAGTGSLTAGSDVAVEPSGRILTATQSTSGLATVTAYTSDGAIDTSFGANGTASVSTGVAVFAQDIAVAPTGDFLVAAQSSQGNEVLVAALTADGRLDVGRLSGGSALVTPTSSASASYALADLLVDGEGGIDVVGTEGYASRMRIEILRLQSGGALDTRFGCGGIAEPNLGDSTQSWHAGGAAYDASGRIVVGGTVITNGTVSDFAVARYLGTGGSHECTNPPFPTPPAPPAPPEPPAPPAPAPSSGGGGGGGGASVPDLAVRLSASAATIAPGGTDQITAVVDNTGGAGSLLTHLVFTLPAGDTLLGAPYYERGSGCTGSTTIDCYLDYIPNGGSTKVFFSIRADTAGPQTISATASADRDSDLSDNAATVTIDVTAAPTPTKTTASIPPRATTKGVTRTGTARADRIVGTPRNDVLSGGGGNDTITGGLGSDVLNGGSGNDTIFARDGQRDTVICGPGRDVAYVDRKDKLTGCEIVHRS